MKKLVSILLTMMLILGTCAGAMFTVGATEATSDTWDGTANIQWYLDGPNADGAYELNSAEDLAGFAFVVNAGYASGRYKGVYYREGGNVVGYVPGASDNALWDTDLIPTDFTGLLKVDGTTFTGKTVVLNVDVVLNEGDASTWTATSGPANVWQPIGGNINGSLTDNRAGFDGTFDGKGHTISGLYVVPKKTDIMFSGLFGYTGSPLGLGTTIKNLTVTNFFVYGESVGALVGRTNKYLGVENVKITNGTVELREGKSTAGVFVGGLFNGPGSFQFCAAENVKVQGKKYMGVFAGCLAWQDIDVVDCYVKGCSVKGEAQVGVIAGRVAGGNLSIQNLYAIAELEATGADVDDTKAAMAGAGVVYGVAGGGKPNIRKIDGFFQICTVTGTVVNTELDDRVTALSLSQITGEAATVFMSSFDYENIWKVVDGDTPTIELRGNMVDQGGEEGGDDDDEFLPLPGGEDEEEETTAEKTDKDDKKEPATTEPTTTADDADKGGMSCGSVVGFSGLMLTAILAGAAVMLKKED